MPVIEERLASRGRMTLQAHHDKLCHRSPRCCAGSSEGHLTQKSEKIPEAVNLNRDLKDEYRLKDKAGRSQKVEVKQIQDGFDGG